jgi:hypothetical protein
MSDMPDVAPLKDYLNSLRSKRAALVAAIDSRIQDVEEMLRKHSENGASATAARATAPQRPAESLRPKQSGRLNFTPKYPGVSLAHLITQALATVDALDRGELQVAVGETGYEFNGKAFDVALWRLEGKGIVRKVPLPLGRKQGKFKNMWQLVRKPQEGR